MLLQEQKRRIFRGRFPECTVRLAPLCLAKFQPLKRELRKNFPAILHQRSGSVINSFCMCTKIYDYEYQNDRRVSRNFHPNVWMTSLMLLERIRIKSLRLIIQYNQQINKINWSEIYIDVCVKFFFLTLQHSKYIKRAYNVIMNIILNVYTRKTLTIIDELHSLRYHPLTVCASQ